MTPERLEACTKAVGSMTIIVGRWDNAPFPAIGYDASQDRRIQRECLNLSSELLKEVIRLRNTYEPT